MAKRTGYGSGSVFLSGRGFWVAQWEVSRLPDGRRRRRQLRAGSEEEAWERMAAAVADQPAPRLAETPEERFWGNFDWPNGEAGCWEWADGRLPKGYGQTSWEGRMWQTHRLAWTLIHGPIPTGLWVLHRCDNPPCANPDHLWIGTAADNTADMIAKGRGRKAGQPLFRRTEWVWSEELGGPLRVKLKEPVLVTPKSVR